MHKIFSPEYFQRAQALRVCQCLCTHPGSCPVGVWVEREDQERANAYNTLLRPKLRYTILPPLNCAVQFLPGAVQMVPRQGSPASNAANSAAGARNSSNRPIREVFEVAPAVQQSNTRPQVPELFEERRPAAQI